MNKVQTRTISVDERNYWDQEIQKFENVHPLNAYGWGHVRKIDGWDPTYIIAEREGKFCGGMIVLIKNIPFTRFSLAYGPKGPVWNYDDKETFKNLIAKALSIIKEKNSIFLRLDPNIEKNIINSNEDLFQEVGFIHLEQRWTFWNSPADVSRIDLQEYANTLEYKNSLDRDTRRCIRKSFLSGVTVKIGETLKDLENFYSIFKDFSIEKGFLSRDLNYQKQLWSEYINRGFGRLFIDVYDNKLIGGIICILFGNKCLAMHMGVPKNYQKFHANYAHVMESINYAKEMNCAWYSFRGTGTTPSQEYFKNKFKPKIVNLIGYYDFPIKKNVYKIFYFLEFLILPKMWFIIISLRKHFNYILKTLLHKPEYK